MREQYLRALRLTNFTHGLGILFLAGAIALAVAALAMFHSDRPLGQQHTVLAFQYTGAAVGALAIVALLHAAYSRKTLVVLIDTLRVDWKLNEAIYVAANIPDAEIRTRLFTMLALQLSGALPTQSMIAEIVARKHTPTPNPAPAPPYRGRETFGEFGGRRRYGRHFILERKYWA